ncbi:MAG: hypothetical protein WB930_06020 [Syntrophobacteraceae bacterium]
MPGPSKKVINLPEQLLNFRYLNEHEVATLTGRGLQTLRNDRSERRGIPYLKVRKSVLYRLSDVLEFMDKHRIQTEEI